MSYNCPVCGFDELDNDPNIGSNEICSCCGVQFGLDDEPESNQVNVLVVGSDGVGIEKEMENSSPLKTKEGMWLAWREIWIRQGMQWFDGTPPKNWNPALQLESAFNK